MCVQGLTEKELFLQALNNDNVISLVLTISGILASFGKLIFGYLFDRMSFKRLFISLLTLFFVTHLLMTHYLGRAILVVPYVPMNIFKGGLNSVEAMGLTSLFGVEMGCQLYPFKGLAYHLAN